MRWPVRSLVTAVLVSFASVATAATLELSDLFDSGNGRGNQDRIRYSGNAAFGTVELSRSDDDRHRGSGNGRGNQRGHRDDRFEALDVDFDRSVFVTSVDLGRLTNGPIIMRVSGAGGGFDLFLDADDADQNGNVRISLNQFASSISFVPTAGVLSDFSHTRITIDETLRSLRGTSSPIPEPSSVVMLLIGGALVASQLRKFV
ncbi:MAG: PEP-CTERM sorting domain-containing protein [Steroidobacteraceae bacterium]